MGDVVSKTASVERIIADFRATLENARLRGGEIRSLAEARLEADKAWSALLAADYESDRTIAIVLDEIWNAMGKPVHCPDYTIIAGEGKSQWTDGDPIRQHYGMRVLAEKIRSSSHPEVQKNRMEWSKRVEMKALAQESAARPAEEAMAQYEVANGSLRAMTGSAQLSLTRLKRDYKNMGMSEEQVHEIIPDRSVGARG